MCPKRNKLFCFICLVMGGNQSAWTQEGTAVVRELETLVKVQKLGKWIPPLLIGTDSQHQSNICTQLLSLSRRSDWLNNFVTGDEKRGTLSSLNAARFLAILVDITPSADIIKVNLHLLQSPKALQLDCVFIFSDLLSFSLLNVVERFVSSGKNCLLATKEPQITLKKEREKILEAAVKQDGMLYASGVGVN
ncbi:hypothetical protein NQ318_021246 [Aromia moschata]|uniref:Uncharacterized protein n=1 Tax=Aromia moschata TaxID=1265417 RepID=A0AAV8ZDE4_9CUCU|nr:hypothetical protein NQ318_021246 [Aromia moschata]